MCSGSAFCERRLTEERAQSKTILPKDKTKESTKCICFRLVSAVMHVVLITSDQNNILPYL
jgi:hypothetical protein